MSNDPLIRRVSFQGHPGAFSDLAARSLFPTSETLPCETFEDAFAACADGKADRAVIPIENSVAGRVADVYQLLPNSGLHIVGEHFLPIDMHLLAPPGATIEGLKTVYSHVHGLAQCRRSVRRLGLNAVVHADTAGAAADVAAKGDVTCAALASSLAGETYGLVSLANGMGDQPHNTTRFVVLSRVADYPDANDGPSITSFVFRVRHVPAALYKAMGGFATNGVNLSKLESYMVGGRFVVAQFYADADGHPDQKPMRLAMEELRFFCRELKILGVYPASPFREAVTMDGD
ncbi:MAG: prephenate dehydratase [Elsteraceae bacterium]